MSTPARTSERCKLPNRSALGSSASVPEWATSVEAWNQPRQKISSTTLETAQIQITIAPNV
jgi:hypothetical protein